MARDLSYCAMEVRNQDWDRFICTLFAPTEYREALFSLLAFNVEIARTREVVSEPMLGEIRLQWWREAIDKIYALKETGDGGEIKGHEVLTNLSEVINKFGLSKDLIGKLIDARSLDLTNDPPADEAALLAYANDSSAVLNELQLGILCQGQPGDEDLLRECVRDAGIAWALTGLVRATLSMSRFGRIMIPQSLLDLNGAQSADILARQFNPEVSLAVKAMCELSRQHISEARRSAPRNTKLYRSILLTVTLAEGSIRRIEKANYNPFSEAIEQGRTRRQIKLAIKALRGGF